MTAALNWINAHPWISLALLAAACLWALRRHRTRRRPDLRIRTRREQARFDPLQTVYSPKGYRRPRTPRKD